MVQTSAPVSTSVGIQPTSSGTVGSLCFNESKARDFEKLTHLVLTSNAFPGRPSRESVQGLVKNCLELCAVYSPALFNERGLSTGMAVELETGWNMSTKSRRDKCSSDSRTAKPKILIANLPCPLFLKLQSSNIGKSYLLESTESTVITTRSHLLFVRECFEQMHRGDHFIFEHPPNASSWNEVCVQKFVAHQACCTPMCRWHLLSGESGFMRELVSWLTTHPHWAQALEQKRENTSGAEPDRHAQAKNGLASARYPVELVESFLKSLATTSKAVKNSRMWQHSRLDRHRTKIVWQKKSLSTTCVAECLKQKQ